jgi:amidohydrolase
MVPDFLAEAQELFEYTRFLRRDFHRHPELSFQEVRTAGVVARELHALGIEVHSGIAKTGVVGLLEGKKPGSVILLRFDIDALPIMEETGAEYASQTPGVMHACGHDGHTAVGLTVARLLHAHQEELAGTVKLVFQPAEEGFGGAELMIEEGVLDNPKPELTLALHLWNHAPLGWMGITAGPVMAAADVLRIWVTGKGGHGAMPHQAVDPVLAAAQVITALQSVVSRNVPPLETAVVTVTMLRAGEAFNVIPPQVEMQGTIRTFDPAVRELVVQRVQQVAEGTAAALGCQAKVEIESVTPAVINEPGTAEQVAQVASRLFPGGKIERGFMTMGSEDMSFMMQKVPGCYFFVGSANDAKGLNYSHHHPKFDVDEDALPSSAALMAAAAYEFLKIK